MPTAAESRPQNSSLFADFSSIEILQHIVQGIEKKRPPLPKFTGDISDFEYFYNHFMKTTAEGNIPPHENMERLKKALGGEAYDLVSGYLDKPSCLDQVLADLKEQ